MAGKPNTLREKRNEYQQALDQALGRIRSRLAQMPEVHKAVLFGSYAQGRRDLCTDIDLIVVMDSDLDFVRRSALLRRQFALGVDLDLFVYTPQEFERMADAPFVRHALRTGKVIYEKKSSRGRSALA